MATLLLFNVFRANVFNPIAIFAWPETFADIEFAPIATLSFPVVLSLNAWNPIAVLSLLVIFDIKASKPTAVFPVPLVLSLSAWYPTAVTGDVDNFPAADPIATAPPPPVEEVMNAWNPIATVLALVVIDFPASLPIVVCPAPVTTLRALVPALVLLLESTTNTSPILISLEAVGMEVSTSYPITILLDPNVMLSPAWNPIPMLLSPPFENKALTPRATFELPTKFSFMLWYPIDVLFCPVVVFVKAEAPIAVWLPPVAFNNAIPPIAVLLPPEIFVFNE